MHKYKIYSNRISRKSGNFGLFEQVGKNDGPLIDLAMTSVSFEEQKRQHSLRPEDNGRAERARIGGVGRPGTRYADTLQTRVTNPKPTFRSYPCWRVSCWFNYLVKRWSHPLPIRNRHQVWIRGIQRLQSSDSPLTSPSTIPLTNPDSLINVVGLTIQIVRQERRKYSPPLELDTLSDCSHPTLTYYGDIFFYNNYYRQ